MSRTIALAWFAREDYPQIRAICEDPLHETFDEWEAVITARMERLERMGLILEKVILRPAELEAWARHQGLPINSNTRAAYAGLLLAQREDGWLN